MNASPTRVTAFLFRSALCTGLLLLTACTGNTRNDAAPEAAVTKVPLPVEVKPAAAYSPPDYLLQTGDVIDVKFFYAPELNETLTIRPDGKISLQLVGDLQAAGLSPSALRKRISDTFDNVLKKPDVAVIVKKYTPNRVYVDGEVRAPGELSFASNLTALQAIIKAGGFSRDAETGSVVIVRARGDATPELIRLNFDASCAFQLPQGDSTLQDTSCLSAQGYQRPEAILVEPFDVIYVPPTRIASVAYFFDQYIGNILPIYRNFGMSLIYDFTAEDN